MYDYYDYKRKQPDPIDIPVDPEKTPKLPEEYMKLAEETKLEPVFHQGTFYWKCVYKSHIIYLNHPFKSIQYINHESGDTRKGDISYVSPNAVSSGLTRAEKNGSLEVLLEFLPKIGVDTMGYKPNQNFHNGLFQ